MDAFSFMFIIATVVVVFAFLVLVMLFTRPFDVVMRFVIKSIVVAFMLYLLAQAGVVMYEMSFLI